jgi:ABC-2 type transport system ATP-binding protein
VIAVSNLSKRFGQFVAVDNLSFEVQPGEVLGVLGPNGAGKTTTMRMVTGCVPPSAGRVRIGGHDLYDRPVAAKRLIGYLPENPPLYPEMTVGRYLRFVAALKDVPQARLTSAVGQALERASLTDVTDTRIGTLSKGYRQRVGLAQALVHEPPVLILDEPTSSLEPRQRTEVRDLIKGLRGYHTVLISTHILPEVSDVADRVVIMNHGRAMAVDTPQNLGGRLRAREVARLEFIVPDPAGDAPQRLCSAVPGVERVEIDIQAGSGLVIAHLESPAGVDVRSAAAEAIVRQGWRLLSLSGETLSLEEIFLDLTADDAAPEAG